MKTIIRNRQIFFVSLTSILGFGLFGAAHIATKYMSTGAWLSILLASLIFIIPATILSALSKKYMGDTLFVYSKKSVGTKAGNVLGAIYAFFYLLFTALLLSYFSHIISMWILPNTNYHLICAFLVLICIYALSRGFTSTVRMVSLTGAVSALAVIIIRITMIASGDMRNLFPLIETNYLPLPLIKATALTSVFFFGIGILAIMPNNLAKKTSKFAAIFGVVIGALMLILICASCFCVLSPLATSIYSDAVSLSMKAFDISRITFIQRADIIFIITWTTLMLSTLCILIYIPHTYIKTALPKTKTALTNSLMGIFVYLVTIIIPDTDVAMQYITVISCTLGIIALFIIPSIILICPEVKNENK